MTENNKNPATVKAPIQHFLAWFMFIQGIDQKEIAKHFKVSDRSIRTWLRNVEEMIGSSADWAKAAMIGRGYLSLAMKVFEKYLTGKGEKLGGDLEAATKIFQIFKILETAIGKGAAGATNIGNQIITAINADIVINPEEDEEFARAVPEQLRRIVGVIERLAPRPMVEGPAESEDTDN